MHQHARVLHESDELGVRSAQVIDPDRGVHKYLHRMLIWCCAYACLLSLLGPCRRGRLGARRPRAGSALPVLDEPNAFFH